ncbi:hypothetical protein [Streptomyces goshikiensis]|uniref:hypothetical protein n=1 Tax=Streptomyces goshikiensis TaxID=1942 RepID=UPI0037210E85
MRLYSTAYLAYGIQIPDTDSDTVEEALRTIDGVGYLTAGRFGDDRTYLTTECYSTDAGEYRIFAPETLASRPEQAAWDAALKAAAEALGHTDAVSPRWFITADLDN